MLLKKRKVIAVVAAAASFALVAGGCSGSSGSGGGGGTAGATGGTLTFGETTDFPANLMPLIAAGNATSVQNIEVRMFLGAFDVQPDFTLKYNSDLLTSEPKNVDKGGVQTTTYEINPKAVWSDGTKMTADDFIFSWNLQKSSDPADGGCAALLSTTGYEQMKSVAAGKDDHEVIVTYAKPYADWQGTFNSVGLFPKHIMDKGSPTATCDYLTKGWPIADGIDKDIANGPYQLLKTNIQADKKIVVVTKNPKWWGTPGKLDKIVINNIGNDPDTIVKSMKNASLNMVYPQPQLDVTKNLKALEPGVKTSISFGLSFEHMDLNTRNVHLAKPEVRQAIAFALDRKDIVSKTVGQFDSRAKVLNNRFYVNNQPQYQDNSGGLFDTANVQKSNQLLEGIGYKKGADGIYVAPDGNRLSLGMSTTVNNPLREQTVDLVTAQMKTAGIEIKKDLDPDIFKGKAKPKSLEAGGFDIALFAWVATPFVTSNVPIYRSVSGDAQGQNYTHGNDPKVDKYLDEMANTADAKEAAKAANAADKQLWQDMYTIPLYQKPTLLSYTSSYQNIQDNASQIGPLWNEDKIAAKS
ncbi:MAG: ABC transporter family substrate-binding protein [Antricoccus sp.]